MLINYLTWLVIQHLLKNKIKVEVSCKNPHKQQVLRNLHLQSVLRKLNPRRKKTQLMKMIQLMLQWVQERLLEVQKQ